jgi:uncharacterized protein (TIGR00730 family)
MRICVFCASSAAVDPCYFEATERLAGAFLKEGVDVVYGGGALGLMGRLADVLIAGGGRVKGVIPRFMKDAEWAHGKLTELELTETMPQRKALLLEGVDGIVALPGGTGTLEELLEAITLKRLGRFTQPIVILNTRGYYDPLKQMLERCVRERFMHPRHSDMWSFVEEPEGVLPAIRGAAAWSREAVDFAVVRS